MVQVVDNSDNVRQFCNLNNVDNGRAKECADGVSEGGGGHDGVGGVVLHPGAGEHLGRGHVGHVLQVAVGEAEHDHEGQVSPVAGNQDLCARTISCQANLVCYSYDL